MVRSIGTNSTATKNSFDFNNSYSLIYIYIFIFLLIFISSAKKGEIKIVIYKISNDKTMPKIAYVKCKGWSLKAS